MASDLQGSTLTINGRAYRPIHASYLASLWAAQNPILQRGEIGIEQDTEKFKIGNGIDRWNDLSYSTGATGPQGPEGPEGPQGPTGDTGVSFSTTATIYTEDNPLPDFVNTPANTGYYYRNEDGVYDVYVHLEDEEDWFVIENWGGIAGPYFTPFVNSTTGDISWTNNGGLVNPTTVNIKGPQGIQGIQGPQGNPGLPGLAISDVVANVATGTINITTSVNLTNAPSCKALFGGAPISGTWSGSNTSWSFVATTPTDIVTTPWIITLP